MNPPWRTTHAAVIFLAVVPGMAAVAKFAVEAYGHHLWFADFTVFWTAAQFADPYNAAALTKAQLWLLPPDPPLRPFVYPPSALLLMKPLGWLGYSAGLAVWSLAGAACFAAAATLYGRRGMLALAGPMFLLSLVIGQASLFLGAALAGGVAMIDKRPLAAGALLGVLGAVKPQLAVLVPLALLCGRHWRALIAGGVAGSLLVAASLSLGPMLWLEWFHSLAGFQQQVLTADFRAMNMAPGMIFAPIGVLSVAYVWLRTERPELRLLAVAAGACLCVPYLGYYDLAAMAPAAGVLFLGRDWRGWIVGLPGFLVLWFSPFIVAVGAPFLVYSASTARHGRSPATPSSA